MKQMIKCKRFSWLPLHVKKTLERKNKKHKLVICFLQGIKEASFLFSES